MNNNDNKKTEVLGSIETQQFGSGSSASPPQYQSFSKQYAVPDQFAKPPQPPPPSPKKTEVLNTNKPPKLIGLLVNLTNGEAHTLLDVNWVGRHDDPQCNIRIADETVSSRHVAIKLEESSEHGYRYFIQDLATTNGTYVNGAQAFREYLKDGDKIEIGKTKWVYKQVNTGEI